MKNLLITGVSGYVGGAVGPLAAAAGFRIVGTWLSHDPGPLPGCELVRAAVDQVPALIRSLRPDVVLHTAAAWRTEDEARAVIVEGARGIALACAETGARLIHLSTDLVFDGEHAPYREDSRPSPVNFYGAAKAEAERIVAETYLQPRRAHPERMGEPEARTESKEASASSTGAVIVRTSLVTCFDSPDPRTQPIVDALAGRRAPVTLFTDEFRCPVRVEDLAAALVELISVPFSGILHVAGPERLSRYDLGLRIARFYGLAPRPGIVPGLAAASGQPRPRDCTLDISLAGRLLQTSLRPLP